MAPKSSAAELLKRAVGAHQSGNLDEAERGYRSILKIGPDIGVLYLLAVVQYQRQRMDHAVELTGRALAVKPDYTDALNLRASALAFLGRFDEALQCYDRALAIEPRNATLQLNRGNALGSLGRHDEAVACYDRALTIEPREVSLHTNRGTALLALNRHGDALASFERALALKPNDATVHYNCGVALLRLNRRQEAIARFDQASALNPRLADAKFAACAVELPVVYAEERQIAERRAAYAARIAALSAEAERHPQLRDWALGIGPHHPFLLPYQAQNDRELQARYGALVSRVMAAHHPPAPLPPPPQNAEPVRVGIVSGFFRQHAVWKIGLKGWVGQLDGSRFQVFGYQTNPSCDAETEFARQHCHRFVEGDFVADRWREIILADRPHVLLYPEIGMNPIAVNLAAQRLARTQCNFIGHPETSGFPTIDYFLSGELIEPPDGDTHYTEKLVRLPNLSFYYEPTRFEPATITRSELGLREGATAYWCCQSLFKYLPQHDAVFPRIAREVPGCQFVFIEHAGTDGITELLRQRLDSAFAAHDLRAADHCVFLPRLDPKRFAAASRLCDVALDSIEWSGGNTTLEALAEDLPVVTMAGAFMRGRVSSGILTLMDMPEMIATTLDDYVATAARLGRDTGWRTHIKSKIADRKQRLYRDRAPITALEDFLDRVARATA